MAVCLLKQVMIVNEQEQLAAARQNALFPTLSEVADTTSRTPKWVYKIRMSSTDGNQNRAMGNFENTQSGNSNAMLSTSLPSTSPIATSPLSSSMASQMSELHNSYDPLLKQAAYQFHLIFQTKAYSNTPGLVDLANRVNQSLQGSSASSMHFCLPQCLNMSKHLCAHLFSDKFYLFP